MPFLNHTKRLVDRWLDDLDVLTFVTRASTVAYAHRSVISADKEVKLLGHGAGTHEAGKHSSHVAQVQSQFLLDLHSDASFRRLTVKQSRSRFDQQAVVTVDVCRIAELSREQDSVACGVERQQRCAIPPVVRFAAKRLPAAVGAPPIEDRFLQDEPVIRKRSEERR